MSLSSLHKITDPTSPVIVSPSFSSRLIEPDEVLAGMSASEQTDDSEFFNKSEQEPGTPKQNWPFYFYSWIFASLFAGVLVGYCLYLIWQHMTTQDQQLAWHQTAIQELKSTQSVVAFQAQHLQAIDTRLDTIQTLFNWQSKKMADLEKGQSGIQNQLTGMNARWQKEMNELRKNQVPLVTAPSPSASNPVSAPPPAASVTVTASNKHQETFISDMKPTPTSYAQMLPNGLVVWMTARPGFPQPVPTSVIQKVPGLGMLVHNWDDNKHYFITDTGSWLLDQR